MLRFLKRLPLVVAAAAVAVSWSAPARAAKPPVVINPCVVPPGAADYPQLSAQWWQWALGQPVTTNPRTTNPLVDTTGVAAYNGQPRPNDVFFLAGLISFNSGLQASVERRITIHEGTYLFFPILNSSADNVGVSPPMTVPQLRAQAAVGANSVINLYTILDGKALAKLSSYRTISPVFAYVLPPNRPAKGSVNLYYAATSGAINVAGLQKPAVGDGYYLLVRPMTRGLHTLQFGGVTQTLDAAGNPAAFQLDVTYHINVVR
jgi:hypothetical protein